LTPPVLEAHAPALLCMYYTQQLLPGLVALLAVRSQQGVSRHGPATVLVWCPPFTPEKVFQRRKQAFEQLLSVWPWITLWMPTPAETGATLSHNQTVKTKAQWLRSRFGDDGFSSIFFAHDVGDDFTAQSLMQAFPTARRICFGDALGMVYSKRAFNAQMYPLGPIRAWMHDPRKYIRHALMRLRRRWVLRGLSTQLDAQCVALILPCDSAGDFLPGKEIVQVPRSIQDDVLHAMALSTQGIFTVHAENAAAQEVVLLTGSFSETKLCSLEQELALYKTSLTRHAQGLVKVIVKPHPASSREKVARVVASLSDRYSVSVVDERLYEIPIEAMPQLFTGRRVLSYSYSSVSLTYLFGAQVVHAMAEDLVRTCFYPASQPWVRESDRLYVEQQAAAEGLRNTNHQRT
jgi:hypothetical protein